MNSESMLSGSQPMLMLCCSQDTNTTQYELMRYIAQTCRCVTIVGDPDQSSELCSLCPCYLISTFTTVYGWRSAEIENLAHMKRGKPS